MATNISNALQGRELAGPTAWVIGGALSLSASSILIAIADASSATTAFWRCTLALPLLAPLLAREIQRHGLPDVRSVLTSLCGGLFLGADFLMWNISIGDIGAGIATVLVNMQVVFFPFVTRLLKGIPLAHRFVVALPILLVAVSFVGGIVGPAPVGGNPVRGTALALAAALGYTGYLYFSRISRVRCPRHVIAPVFLSTAAAGSLAGLVGIATSSLQMDLIPGTWITLAFVALSGQALGWLLIGRGLPRLEPAVSSPLLMLQPVGAEILAIVVLGEIPTTPQIIGSIGLLTTVCVLATGAHRAPRNKRTHADVCPTPPKSSSTT